MVLFTGMGLLIGLSIGPLTDLFLMVAVVTISGTFANLENYKKEQIYACESKKKSR